MKGSLGINVSYVFEMAAMPFPCNGLMRCCINLPSCCSIPDFNMFLNLKSHPQPLLTLN